ncbi:helix-turn-helix domain-containing protein [Sandaracinus amylolyticus]|uniref:helix-turn-helix domain-containing protein n=1 Tax=Sandaracinus amylolyticus TaxID=927083 RepID=UPI001F3D08E6|nr:helix-turn-helix domain-containing protein [Sandaracinus amylolyticus]UJR84755.1 Hypothetical protein I5071_68340 [Sandaracinus amylolyticus]
MTAERTSTPFDARTASAEIVRALRGARSQRALSARLGYRVNVLTGWESGKRAPPAHEVLRLARRVGRDLRVALVAFDARLDAVIGAREPAGPELVASILRTLIDERTHTEIARALGETRTTVARWALGRTAPRFGDLLRIVDLTTHRLVDFIACFADPAAIPAVAHEHARIEAQRALLREDPAFAVVLPVLTLRDYRRLARHREGWIAKRVGIDVAQERRALELLEAAGAIRRHRGKWEVLHDRRVDVRHDRATVARLQQHWAQVAADRTARVPGDVTRFHLVSVAESDLETLRRGLAELYERLDATLAGTRDPERVVLVGVMLQVLDRAPT